MARDGGVRGEKRCEGREKWEMRRKKEKKHAGKKKLWENFCGKKNKSGGKACPIGTQHMSITRHT